MMTNLSISTRKPVLKSDDWLLGYFKVVTCCHCDQAVSKGSLDTFHYSRTFSLVFEFFSDVIRKIIEKTLFAKQPQKQSQG